MKQILRKDHCELPHFLNPLFSIDRCFLLYINIGFSARAVKIPLCRSPDGLSIHPLADWFRSDGSGVCRCSSVPERFLSCHWPSIRICCRFSQATGLPVLCGGLDAALTDFPAPERAIVAVGVDQLFPVAGVDRSRLQLSIA